MEKNLPAKPNGRRNGVAHHLPYRTRYRLASHHRNADIQDRINASISKVPGVKKVEFNERTGSVLVHHDEIPEILGTLSGVMDGIAGDLFEEIAQEELAVIPGMSLTAHITKKHLAKIDRYCAKMTNNLIDLKMLLPLVLLGAGFYQASRKNAWFESVPPLVFLYYAYDSYLKFHAPRGESQPHGNGHQFN